MLRFLIKLLVILVFGTFALAGANAQTGNASPFAKEDDKSEGPMGVKEMLKKLEIEKEKKDFEEMRSRGKQALDLSNELAKSFDAHNQLSEKDRTKLATLEKLVRKIRSDLGASDTDADDAGDLKPEANPSSAAEGFKDLRTATIKLVDELQKATRFTVSVTAIKTTNAVLRLARFLKFWK